MKLFLAIFLAAVLLATTSANPGECNQCFPSVNASDNLAFCNSEQKNKSCGLGDEYAIGTTHCFTVALRFKCVNGSSDVHSTVARGCINCSNKTAACMDFASRFKSLTNWTSLDCNMECCNSANCNNQNVTVLPLVTTLPVSTTSAMTATPTGTAKGNVCRHLPISGVLVFAVIIYSVFSLF